VAVGAALVASGNWMLQTLVAFTEDLFAMIPSLLA
jgi:flagellar biosynthetic protein FliQ